MAPQPAAADGRSARSARTREAIADAVLELLETDAGPPTSLAIAARAGVAERTLFHHFADLELLFAEVAERQMQRVLERFPFVPAVGSARARAAALVAQRAGLHEFVTPVRRAALGLEPRSPVVAARLARARRALRDDALRVFAAEIAAAPAARRNALRDGLALATGWSGWEHLRRHAGLSVPRARAAVQHLVLALLGER